MTIIDLTHDLAPDIPSWDGSNGFKLETILDYEECTPPDLFRVQKINCSLSMGTHMDAPSHVVKGGRNIDQLIIDELVNDCAVIDLSAIADEQYVIMPEVVKEFENKYGLIKPKSLVIFHTGWSKKWGDRNAYNNEHKFPSVHIDTAKLLLERNISGLGVDTFSVDTGANGYPVHNLILGADKYLVENIFNAEKLPPVGAKVFVIPMKIRNATEAPVRLFASI